MSEPQEARRQGHIEGIRAHVPLDGLDSARWVSCKNESLAEAPIREIWIERHRALELGNRNRMLMPPHDDMSELCTSVRQIGVELHGLARQLIRPVEGNGIEIV